MTRKLADTLSGLGFLALAAIFWLAGRDLEGISRVFPLLLEIFLAAGGLLLLISGIRRAADDLACEGKPIWGRVWLIAAASAAYVLLVPIIGFYVTSFAFLFLMAELLSRGSGLRHLAASAGFAVVLCALVYLVFNTLLLVPTPEGVLF